MNMNLSEQTITFLFSLVIGATLSILFDVFKIVNVILKYNKKRVFFQDVAYFFICAVITFLYMLIINMGEIRIYIIVGEVFGWVLYKVTIGKFIYKFILTIVLFITKCLKSISKVIKNVIVKFVIRKIPKTKTDYFNNKIKMWKQKIKKKFKFKHRISKKSNV